jgi:uncharacterized caspase-like protein
MFCFLLTLFLSLPSLAQAAAGEGYGRYHALVIGNDDYAHLPKLATAISDAVATAGLLRGKYGFEVTLLLNATGPQILISLDWLKSTLTAKDRLLIYYAGHGALDPESGAGFWLPVDAEPDKGKNWIANDDLSHRLAAMAALHVMVVADSYEAGGPARAAKAPPKAGAARDQWLQRLAKTRSRTALVSGGLQPVAAAGAGGHSAFAKAFLEVLGDNGGILDGQTLFQRLRAKAVQNGAPAPRYSNIAKAGHAGGDFLFVPRELACQAPAKPVAAPAKPVAAPADPDRMELAFWNSVKDSDEAAMFGAYLKKYPDGLFAELAQLRLQRLQSKRTPAPAIVLEPIEGTFVALRNANVRAAPNVSAAIVATLTKGGEIYVPGKVAGENWLAVDRNGKRLGYVFASLLQDIAAIEEAQIQAANKRADEDARAEGAFEIKLSGTHERGNWELETCRGTYAARRGKARQ